MPFRIDKVKGGFRIYNLEKKKYTNPEITPINIRI